MDNSKSEPEEFDVFLCHHSVDKPEVIIIADELSKQGIKVWLDKNDIMPGEAWQDAINQQIDTIDAAVIFIGNSGIGPWQDMEVQAFLNQYVTRKCRVIPVFLPSVQDTPKLPNLLKNLHSVDFRQSDPDPLLQLLRGIKGKQTTSSVFFNIEPIKSALALPEQTDFRVYPPLTDVPSKEQRSQLFILLRRVKEFWIDGVLKQSLYNEVLISLGKTVMDEAVETPFHRIVELPIQHGHLQNDTPIDTVFDAAGLLIILGEPGSGKTTTLLQLVQRLIKRAEANSNERIPIVLNLSSWKKGQLLSDWMVDSLHRTYNVPTKLARRWLDKGYLIPLLDGLDEVKKEHQADCVVAINDYIVGAEPTGFVVCCRLVEYQWLPERLKVNGAICIEPLNREQIDQYFAAVGTEFESLRRVIQEDTVLQELAQSPLMLNIMSMAYQSATAESFTDAEQSLESRRTQIFDAYVDKMFQRKASLGRVFPKEKVVFWLSWLAKKMMEQSQSVLFIENLQPSWLDNWKQRFVYRGISSLNFGLFAVMILVFIGGMDAGLISWSILALVIGLSIGSNSSINNGIISGLIVWLSVGVSVGLSSGLGEGLSLGLLAGMIVGPIIATGIGTLNNIKTIETINWSWKLFYKKLLRGFLFGFLLIGLSIGLLFGIANVTNTVGGLGYWLIYGLILGLIVGSIYGLIGGILGGFTDKIRENKALPNQGIILTIKNVIFVAIITVLIVGMIVGLIVGLIEYKQKLFLVLIAALIVGLNRGLGAVIKHYALRLVLWCSGKTPFKFIPFLDYCAKLILLKKVGGGYIFIHRMLLEYFAKLRTVDNKSTKV